VTAHFSGGNIMTITGANGPIEDLGSDDMLDGVAILRMHDSAVVSQRSALSLSAQYLLGGLLAIMLTVSQLALAQSPQSCTISPAPPPFTASASEDQLHALPHPKAGPHTFFHGQGLYGKDTLYLNHLAVFMGRPEAHPHNFQVLLEVEFENSEAKARYRSDRAQHPDVIYTATPPVFDQGALVADYPGRKPLRRFPQTTVFRGHFEQGGEPIIQNTTLEIKRVVHFREFFLNGPKLEKQHYLLFGRGNDVMLSHLLSAPPDFDQFLAAELKLKDIPNETVGKRVEDLLAQGLYLRLSDRENAVETRLRTGDALTCNLETGTRALPITVELRVTDELYCEAGEFVKLVMNQFNEPRRCGD
jgi:hypothetical protein